MKRVEGKVIIVTGAASGQGAVEARLMAKEGAKVVGTDINKEGLDQVIKEINDEFGDVAIGIEHDVADEAAWKNVMEETMNKFGRIDVLVNNARYLNKGGYANIEDVDSKDWNLTMNVNVLGNFLGIQSVIPYMKEAKSGSIINISSISGLVGGQDGVHYTSSKGANRLMAKGSAVELGKYNIRVNSIHPGYIDTPMMATVFDSEEEMNELIEREIPLGYAADSLEIANVVLFLASDDSSYITGTEIVVDGGLTAK